MNMAGRFKCPECKGEGYVWLPPNKYFDQWRAVECAVCESHRFVLTDESGCIVGPDAPRRYMCDHKEVLTKCGICSPQQVLTISYHTEGGIDGSPVRK